MQSVKPSCGWDGKSADITVINPKRLEEMRRFSRAAFHAMRFSVLLVASSLFERWWALCTEMLCQQRHCLGFQCQRKCSDAITAVKHCFKLYSSFKMTCSHCALCQISCWYLPELMRCPGHDQSLWVCCSQTQTPYKVLLLFNSWCASLCRYFCLSRF